MATHQDNSQLVTRRGFFLGSVMTAAFSTLLGRLFYLQFVRREEFTTQAEDNSIKIQLVAPVRGQIVDRHETVMAGNEKNFRLFIDVNSQSDLELSVKNLTKVIPLSDEHIQSILDQAEGGGFRLPVLVKEHLTWDELSQFEFASPRHPGVFVDIGQVRFYPFAERASHLIGYVGTVAEDEMEDDQETLMRLSDFKIGKSGVEKMLEPQLRGSPGVKHIEVNVHNVPVRELSNEAGIPGKDIHLTIDAGLQDFASQRLATESASAVVMDVTNGDILALVSMPSYDANKFSLGITKDYWKELQENPKTPLINKSIGGMYPPGSTFKMMTGMAALEHKATTPTGRVYCPGHFMLGTHKFDCWKTEGHGSVDLHDAIEQSCDVYFYTMAQRLGIDPIAAMARKFGLGHMHNIGVIGEKPGLIPDEEWKKTKYNQEWNPGDTINAGIGQGYVLATPMQLAVMTARLVNGGANISPRLVRPAKPTPPGRIDVNTDHLQSIMKGMEAVANEQHGTAFAARIKEPRFAMGGKTGTAQVKKLIAHNINQNSLPWEDRHHALFVGYAPIFAPKYACAIIVEHGGGGAATAAPMARDILQKIQEIDNPASIIGPPAPQPGKKPI